MNIHETKQRIYALDEKRSAGRWEAMQYEASASTEAYSWCVTNYNDSGANYTIRINDQTERDAQFIAAAPDMVDVIKAQDELLRGCLPYVIDGQLADAGAALHASNMGLESKQSHSEKAQSGKALIKRLKAALGESEG